ncbi:hypothetical protein ACTQY8_05560 [Collinsella bouchesdurhonensis]|uniref:hypothetical protein n=1 Tax=Collinsella bouchesdurhonensis TaxID=1907654 RepID=UPI003F9274EB
MQVLDSFIDAALSLSKRREGDELVGMIVRYLRTGAEPSPRTEVQRAVLIAIGPSMENSRVRIVAGREGGSKTPSKRPSEAPSKTASKTGNKTPSKRPSEEEEEEEITTEEAKEGGGLTQPEAAASAVRRRFIAPTLEQVRDYAAEKRLVVDCERFIDYYTANGWKVGRNPMKDWKAAVRNWGRESKPKVGGFHDEYSNL